MTLKVVRGRIITEMVWKMIRIWKWAVTQSAVGVPHVIDDGHADRVIDHNLKNFWIWFLMKLNYRRRALAYFCLYSRAHCRTFCSRKDHDVRRSRLLMHDEPESSVHYRCSCLQAEVRSYLYAAWHSVLMKINEVWIFDSLRFREFFSAQIICRLQWNIFAWTLLLVEFDGYPIFAALCHVLESEFGVGLLLCVHLRWKYSKFCLKRIMSRSCLHYSVAMNQRRNLQYVTVVIACKQRSDPI